VTITVSVNALPAHTRHQHGEDIVNPTGPCGAAAAKAIPADASQQVASALGGDGGASPAAAQAPTGTGSAPAGGGVRGVATSSDDPPPADVATVRDRADASGSSGSLPFTGFLVLILALAGTTAVLLGTKLRGSTPARR
jgi:hypothetical protein